MRGGRWYLLFLGACDVGSSRLGPSPISGVPAPESFAATAAEPVGTVILAAVGDVLPHRAVKATAREHGWDTVFGEVAPLLAAADVAFANLEGPLAPLHDNGVYDEVFNAPADLADGLVRAGFDVVSTANNHAWDQGVDGMLETLGNLDRVGLGHAGTGRSCAEARAPWVTVVRGVRVAVLAAVDLMNFDLAAGEDAPCVFVSGPVCTGDCGPDRDAIHFALDEARLTAAVRAARASADLVVMSFHWGNEYRTVPLPEYPALARALVAAGADVVLGHHPHMLQPIERVSAAGREGLVVYSLGNFVSNMAADYDPGRSAPSRGNLRDGGLLRVELIRAADGSTRVGEARLVPLWTENNAATRGSGPHLVRVVPHDVLRARALEQSDAELARLLDLRLRTIAEVVGSRWVIGEQDP